MRRLAWCLAFSIGCGQPAHDEHEHEHEEEEEEHARAEGDVVQLDATSIERAGIAIGHVERRAIGGGARIPAEVTLDPTRTAHVTSLVPGRVKTLLVALGDRVRAGQTLAVMSSAEIGETRSAMTATRARLEAAELAYQRQQQLASEGVGAQRALVEAEAELRQARAALAGLGQRARIYGQGGAGADVDIVSPIDGQIVEQHAIPGEAISTDRALFVVSDPEHAWVIGQVPENRVAAARQGAPVVVRLRAYPDASWPGEISFVAPALDSRTRTLPVRVVLANPDGQLRAGLFGSIEIASEAGGGAVLAVPRSAVTTIDGQNVVFVPSGENAFRRTPVEVGRNDADHAEITSGLADGAPLVVEGVFSLKSELLRGLLDEDGHSH